jgi:hypothetical protein
LKNKISIIAIVILMLSVTACGSGNTTSDNASQSASNTENSAIRQGNPGGGPSGQMQQADLMGEVTSVSGNQVELKLVEMPRFNNGNRPPQENGKGPADSTATDKKSNNATADTGKDTGVAKGERPQGNKQPPQMSMNYTGETKTITIPDSVSISSMGRGKDNSEQKTLSISDIKAGSILQIWYSDEAKETISKVSVMQAMSGGEKPSDQK